MRSRSLEMEDVCTGNLCELDAYRLDKEAAEAAVKVAVESTNIDRFVFMLDTLKGIMVRHQKKELKFRDFVVTLTKNGIPLIRGRKTSLKCPGCGSLEGWKYLQTIIMGKPRSQDLVAWGCKQCGEIFNRWERNWDDCG